MSLVDDVSRALKPLYDRGVVHMVHPGFFGVSEGVGNSQGERSVTVLVNGDDPEAYRAEVERLVREAGLNVTLSVKPNPARAG